MQTDTTISEPGPSGPARSADPGRPGLADRAGEAARREFAEARDGLKDAAHRAREEAGEARASVSRFVQDEIDRRKDELCADVHGLAEAMRSAAREAESRDDAPSPPRFVHQAIDTLDDMADRLRGHSTGELAGAVSRFGRENPALFVAGALFAGLAVGRMLVASDDRDHRPAGGNGSLPGWSPAPRDPSAGSAPRAPRPQGTPGSAGQDFAGRAPFATGGSGSGGAPGASASAAVPAPGQTSAAGSASEAEARFAAWQGGSGTPAADRPGAGSPSPAGAARPADDRLTEAGDGRS